MAGGVESTRMKTLRSRQNVCKVFLRPVKNTSFHKNGKEKGLKNKGIRNVTFWRNRVSHLPSTISFIKTWFKYSNFSTLQWLPKGKGRGGGGGSSPFLFFIFKVEWKDKFLIAIKRMKITSIFPSPRFENDLFSLLYPTCFSFLLAWYLHIKSDSSNRYSFVFIHSLVQTNKWQ